MGITKYSVSFLSAKGTKVYETVEAINFDDLRAKIKFILSQRPGFLLCDFEVI